MGINWYQAILAVGALGIAATGLVDTTKVFAGGLSRAGFGYIKKLIERTVGKTVKAGAGLKVEDILGTLRANWMNGMETGAQKAIAKTFIKLHLHPATAETMAVETNVSSESLAAVAQKLASVSALNAEESDVYGRFDLALSAMVDRAYERADQLYRNSCKAAAAAIAVALAYFANLQLHTPLHGWSVLIIGLIATPIAPVAKDIANAIQAASDAVGAVKG